MSLAREKLAAAEANADRDSLAARRSAEQAEVDARLALEKTRRARAEEGLAEHQKTIRALEEEMQDDVP